MLRLSRGQAFKVLDTFRNSNDGSDEAMGVVDSLQQQLDYPNHADDLVETIAKILSSPKTKNILNGSFLDMLRAAILSPIELARLQALSTTYQACKGCGRELMNGEIASLHNQDPFCYSCIVPDVMRCPHCREQRELPSGVYRVMQKAVKECPTCKVGAAPRTAAEATIRPTIEEDTYVGTIPAPPPAPTWTFEAVAPPPTLREPTPLERWVQAETRRVAATPPTFRVNDREV